MSMSYPGLAAFAFPKSPDTKTTNTAEYAAVAAKMLSRLALVLIRMPTAKRMMNMISNPSRESGSCTKYRSKMDPTRSTVAMEMLINETRSCSWCSW